MPAPAAALCTAACAEEAIDPAFMMRLAKMRRHRRPGRAGRSSRSSADTQFSPKVKAFARLTMSEQEQSEWL